MSDVEDMLNTNTSPWSNRRILDVMNIPFQNMLTNESLRITQPPEINISLRPHQLALIHAMYTKERECMEGIDYKSTTTYSNYGILGDDVGTGKSLVVLGYIAYLKQKSFSLYKNVLYNHSSQNMFTVQKKEYDNKEIKGTNLLIVPHTIYKQWEQYCMNQTSLNIFYAKSIKTIRLLEVSQTEKSEEYEKEKNTLCKKILGADLVLVSNTLYGQLQDTVKHLGIRWLRIFLDEADNIHIPGTQKKLNGVFTWFISATWPNIILEGNSVRPSTLATLQEHHQEYSPRLEVWIQNELGIKLGTQFVYGKHIFYGVRSRSWLVDYSSRHMLRGSVVIHNTPEFLQESEQMPPIYHQNILCEQSVSQRVLRGIITPEMQSMMDAGNIDGALESLGVSVHSSQGIVKAVTEEREKELRRLEKTLEFKQQMDYNTPQAKENALAILQTKINSVKEQLKTIGVRLDQCNITEECPICYENAKENNCTLTPCCNHMFCGKCILQSLARQATCPMCRATVIATQLVHIVQDTEKKLKKKEVPKLLSKSNQLLEFLKANPTAQVLIFSRYENPFTSLGNKFTEEGISHHILSGNKDVVASTIRSFETGEKRVLFLPTQSAGAGINLVTATHVVLLHAMTPDEEKQVIGRAYRLGRKDPLHVIHLLHEAEQPQ